MSRSTLGFVLALLSTCALLQVTAAEAQDVPAAPTAHQERVAARDAELREVTRLQITAGSAFVWGNARSLAFNLAGQFQLRREMHSLTLDAGWIYGLAWLRDNPGEAPAEYADPDENANNLTWRARYDWFLDDDNALFILHRGRRDPFAALAPRLVGQLGYRRSIFREENHQMWGDIGYDFTYDRFTPVVAAALPEGFRILHSLRLFVGYENLLNELLTYKGGIEVLFNVEQWDHVRIEWVNQLRTKVESWLEVALDFTMRVDSNPPGQVTPWNETTGQGVQILDIMTTLNLVGSFDIEPPVPVEEPAAEEPAPVEAVEEPAAEELPPVDAAEEPVVEEPPAVEVEIEAPEAGDGPELGDAPDDADPAGDDAPGDA